MSQARIIIVAGPNGAGKTTFARQYLPREAGCPTFVNADMIAEGVAPFRPGSAAVRAARIMLSEMQRHARAGRNFAFETTLAGRGHLGRIRRWRAAGYRIALVFLSLPTAEDAIDRVRERVRHGGHNVPEETIRRRFVAGWRNFREVYRHEVDEWSWYDNSGSRPMLIERGGTQ